MPWLALNGINVGAIASLGDAPKVEPRDIGDMSPAGDGSLRVTRQNRKWDFKLSTVPLKAVDAYAWEGLVIGEGETWSFDSSLYGSKGLGPNAGFNASVVAGSAKFGAGKLRVPATTGTITFNKAGYNASGAYVAFTAMVWRFEGGAWHHYIWRSDNAKWLDGVRNDAAVTTWLSVSTGSFTIANVSGAADDYDDLVILPYNIPDAWGPVFGTALEAFSALPYVHATGLMVPEQTTRRVLGACSSSVLVATPKGATTRQTDMKRLSIELKAA